MRAAGEWWFVGGVSRPWRDIRFGIAMRSRGWWLKGVLFDPAKFWRVLGIR